MELEKEPTKIYKIFKDGKVKNWYFSFNSVESSDCDEFKFEEASFFIFVRDYWTKFISHCIRLLKVTPEETGLFIIEV